MPVRKKNTITERAGVNYVRSVVEANNSVFKEIDRQHDYGHDAFVLLVEGEQVLPKEIALQIKAGATYCTATTCRIPATAGQIAFWAGHDLVTLGVVYDPDEDAAYWVDLQTEARNRTFGRREQAGAVIEFRKSGWNRLDARLFAQFLVPTLQGKAPYVDLKTATAWARSDDPETHHIGVSTLVVRHPREPESWARSPEDLSSDVCIGLAKMMGHDDIGFYSDQVPADLRRHVRQHVLQFGPRELAKVLAHVEQYDFSRPSMGYSLLPVLGARSDSPAVIAAIRDDATFDPEIRAKAAHLLAIYEDDPHWFGFWRRDAQ
jgi:homoserine acetyltransferase